MAASGVALIGVSSDTLGKVGMRPSRGHSGAVVLCACDGGGESINTTSVYCDY